MSHDLQPFPIFAPVLGLRTDAPALLLDAAMQSDNANVLIDHGEIHRAKKPVKEFVDGDLAAVAMPDGNAILLYHFYEKDDGTSFLLAFTSDHIYHWDAVGAEWDLKHTCRHTCTQWMAVTFNNMCIATNNGWLSGTPADRPLYWDGAMSLFQNLAESTEYSAGTVAANDESATLTGSGTEWDGAVSAGDRIFIAGQTTPYVVQTVVGDTEITMTGAFDGTNISGKTYVIQTDNGPEYDTSKYIGYASLCCEFENYLIFGYLQMNGDSVPQGIYWSDLGDHTNFLTADADGATLPNAQKLTGFGHYADFLMIFKEQSFFRMWLTANDLVFNIANMSNILGTWAPHSVVNGAGGELYFYASDATIRQVNGSTGDFPIVSEPVHELVREIPDNYVHLVRSLYIPRYRATMWSIPAGADATANNKSILRNDDGVWVTADAGYSALAKYLPTAGYTIDTIPFDTIDEIAWDTIDMVEIQPGFRPLIGGDTDGKSWRLFSSVLDNNDSYEGQFTLHVNPSPRSMDPRVSLAYYKRIQEIELWLRREESGTVQVSTKRDFESTFQTAGSVSLTSDDGEEFVRAAIRGIDLRCRSLQLKMAGSNRFRFVGLIVWYTMEEGRR